mmetsp:Transcript_17594/g.30297  ORF Transcript_17594/g.30297 Transcript_17594/m.30297 type:complete len:170 (-) Transcript_17594:1177-1686(-)
MHPHPTSTTMNVYEDNICLEQLKRAEAEQQKAIASYSNYELKASSGSSQDTTKKALAEAKQLRQNEEDGLRNGDVTEDDHGKKSIGDDDEFFEDSAIQVQDKKRSTAMMEAQRELCQDSYQEFSCYEDGSTATMDTYYEEFKESTFSYEEVSYTYDSMDYRGDDVSNMY